MSFQLPDSIVDTLLDKLACDDEFRARFTDDARGALASLGYAPAADRTVMNGIWECLKVKSLASKEAIRSGRDEYRLRLTTAFIPLFHFALESSERTSNAWLDCSKATAEAK
jgi:putative modified peptide